MIIISNFPIIIYCLPPFSITRGWQQHCRHIQCASPSWSWCVEVGIPSEHTSVVVVGRNSEKCRFNRTFIRNVLLIQIYTRLCFLLLTKSAGYCDFWNKKVQPSRLSSSVARKASLCFSCRCFKVSIFIFTYTSDYL